MNTPIHFIEILVGKIVCKIDFINVRHIAAIFYMHNHVTCTILPSKDVPVSDATGRTFGIPLYRRICQGCAGQWAPGRLLSTGQMGKMD